MVGVQRRGPGRGLCDQYLTGLVKDLILVKSG
jgi:hypothetical protein